ncbi:Phosphoglycerate mutase [hydrothermal vent metagenome]|uniref:phosphoglycerate mutase (2,3-diphosphoglycerate-dependent) n=1 Tax=hydrothermal vent metagenome TaxID=652676 RepID=A0A3B0RFA2_9ZZZZ
MPVLVLVRHGQSEWNLANRFTGWMDVDLTEQGVAEAIKSGQLLRDNKTQFDAAFTSLQTRAIRTLWLALEQMDMCWLPTSKDYRLNERHYGGLTGLNKAETAEKHGAEQVHIWRRSYDIPPPEMAWDNPLNPCNDRRYAALPREVLPAAESLKMTLERVLPYYSSDIAPMLANGKNLLVSAHGNSLRALVKHLFAVADDEISKLEIPTGNPLCIELDKNLRPLSARYLDTTRARDLPVIP